MSVGLDTPGSCALDSQDRAWGIVVSTATWGNDKDKPSAHATVIVKLPE